MTDPTPNGQTWRCGRTDPHTPHASYADHEKVCPGIPRPVPPAPSQRDPELAAALNEQRRQSYNAETLRTRPAPRSDTPSDERACVSCNGTGRTPSPTGMAQIGGMSCAGCFGTGKKENPIVLSNECSDPDPNGGAPCCRPLGHHVLTDHWNGQDEWPAQPAPSSDTLADEAQRTHSDRLAGRGHHPQGSRRVLDPIERWRRSRHLLRLRMAPRSDEPSRSPEGPRRPRRAVLMPAFHLFRRSTR